MATTRQKVKRAEAALQRVEEFVAAGGDPTSESAATVGLNFMSAFADVAKEFGYHVPKPAKEPTDVNADRSK